jgi:hypothetical protein
MTINTIEYTKSIVVLGGTKKHKDFFMSLGCKFNPRLRCGAGWLVPKSNTEKVHKVTEFVHTQNTRYLGGDSSGGEEDATSGGEEESKSDHGRIWDRGPDKDDYEKEATAKVKAMRISAAIQAASVRADKKKYKELHNEFEMYKNSRAGDDKLLKRALEENTTTKEELEEERLSSKDLLRRVLLAEGKLDEEYMCTRDLLDRVVTEDVSHAMVVKHPAMGCLGAVKTIMSVGFLLSSMYAMVLTRPHCQPL